MAHFFLQEIFTGIKNSKNIIKKLKENGNYLGSHSDKHLLYCDWEKRDSLLVTHQQFTEDLQNAYKELNNGKLKKTRRIIFYLLMNGTMILLQNGRRKWDCNW